MRVILVLNMHMFLIGIIYYTVYTIKIIWEYYLKFDSMGLHAAYGCLAADYTESNTYPDCALINLM
jgi:hypothetical protein